MLTALLTCVTLTLQAQINTYQKILEADLGEGRVMTTMSNGDVVLGARHSDFMANVNAVQLVRFDATGQVLWGRKLSNAADPTDYLVLNDVAHAANGDILLCGSHGYGTQGDSAFVIRTDGAGSVLWAKNFKASGTGVLRSRALRVREAPNTDVVVLGETDLDNGGLESRMHITRFNTGGTVLWTKDVVAQIFGTGQLAGDVRFPPDGGMLVFGQTLLLTEGSWLMRLNDAGNKLWVRQLNTNANGLSLEPVRLFPTSAGYDLFYHSEFTGFTSMLYRIRTDTTGTVLAAQQYDVASGDGYANDVTALPGGGYAVAGWSDAQSSGLAVLFTLDASGQTQWAMDYGGGDYEHLNTVAPTGDGGFLLAGTGIRDSLELRGGTPVNTYLVKTDGSGISSYCETQDVVTGSSTNFASIASDLDMNNITGWADATYNNDPGVNAVDVCVVSTVPEHAAARMQIQPNPTRDSAVIHWGASPVDRVLLLDMTGRVVLIAHASGTRTDLDLGQLAPGTYLVLATNAGMPVVQARLVRL
ncbi:MAG: T9SS type A sorting domain-containing protein [Flavobacteriales bacterium]|nr:T9SS type A sorting domain-containing protein [Flavobacteriales bacterium]MCB9166549.1 T9SS type A sorting domain-containing protein [Flavobacteriales bacterium]